ncbi:hypothetical protein [Bosea sp. RAC05]|uniref:hypothetical protein n=1 Tax=Bosea sp. RAC05 TaxID=1842539 RepID=UPI0008585539|nr:hypothetical protein [Bosea sp. RAC05]AOG03071.1 hypothetical protein BSY19_4840 [Bosea sp. RAC05]
MSDLPDFDSAVLKTWEGGDHSPETDEAVIWPIYRGPSNPAFGERIRCARASRLNWTHDGSDDDIVGYRVALLDTPDETRSSSLH